LLDPEDLISSVSHDTCEEVYCKERTNLEHHRDVVKGNGPDVLPHALMCHYGYNVSRANIVSHPLEKQTDLKENC
jgi:hypothetical protein